MTMSYVKVTIVLIMLRIMSRALTLPAEATLTLDRPSHDHIAFRMSEIQDARSSTNVDDDDVRGDNLLLNPDVKTEDRVPIFRDFVTTKNYKGRRMWRASGGALPLATPTAGRRRSGKEFPDDVKSKKRDGRILDHPLLHLLVPARKGPRLSHPVVPEHRAPSPSPSSGRTSEFTPSRASSTRPPREGGLLAPTTLGSEYVPLWSSGVAISHASHPTPTQSLGSPTDEGARGLADAAALGSSVSADVGDGTREKQTTSPSYSNLDDNISDLEFFWSWEAILLVSLPGAWLATVAVLCLLTRSALGKRLLAKLCPASPGTREPEAGHGIGFIDGSPGMRRRLTQTGDMLAAVACTAGRYTEEEGDGGDDKEPAEQTMGRGEDEGLGGCVGPDDASDSDVWRLQQQGRQPLPEAREESLAEYQKVLRKLSLIQEEMSP
ncbi:uncharacterized protein [Panulirus ornatus]|uniref:uncharacterized protein n=1 Tax=Panulirus ornatus TaxID=150431 RepID=UPI003A8C3B4B